MNLLLKHQKRYFKASLVIQAMIFRIYISIYSLQSTFLTRIDWKASEINITHFIFLLLGSRDSFSSNVDTLELCRQLKYWQCLRQDLERARLLCELVRKREKTKLLYTKYVEKCYKIQLKPFQASLENVLNLIVAKDTNEIFSEPVDLEEVRIFGQCYLKNCWKCFFRSQIIWQ